MFTAPTRTPHPFNNFKSFHEIIHEVILSSHPKLYKSKSTPSPSVDIVKKSFIGNQSMFLNNRIRIIISKGIQTGALK